MPDDANPEDRIRNGGFARGRREPVVWRWHAGGGPATWGFAEGLSGPTSRSVRIETASPQAQGGFVQRVRCRQKQWYRIEVVLQAPGEDSARGRFALRLEQFDRTGRSLGRQQRLGPTRCDSPIVWRQYFRTDDGARAVELGVFRVGGPGRGDIGRVRFIPTEAPEATAHPLAVPPPPRAYPPPRIVKSVVLVGDNPPDALREALHARFGKRRVRQTTTTAFAPNAATADGMILFDDPPARTIGSWKALLRLAASKLVVVSPTLFARLASKAGGGPVEPRTLRQDDDPICVKVRDANFVTRGFALLDVFAYSRYAANRAAFELRCLRRSRALKVFVEKNGILTALVSEAATDATTDLPVCLVRPTVGGAVVTLDLAPFAGSPCTEDALNLAAFLLFNALGQSQCTSGQYIVPQMSPASISLQLKELVECFGPLRFGEASGQPAPNQTPPVLLGPKTEGLGLPVAETSTVLIRTGLDGRDWVGLYATLLWLKNLLRHEPWCAPHLRPLLSRYRFVWEPIADWRRWGRWTTKPEIRPTCLPAGVIPTSVALLIDLTTAKNHACRVVVRDDGSAFYRRLSEMLPRLDADLRRSRPTLFRPADGADPADRSSYGWRRDFAPIEVVAEKAARDSRPNFTRVRVELPRYFDQTGANSLWQAERAVTLIEWLVGLHGGLIAVNREPGRRAVSIPTWLGDGQPLVSTADGRTRPAAPWSHGDGRASPVRLAPGQCLFVTLPNHSRRRTSPLAGRPASEVAARGT